MNVQTVGASSLARQSARPVESAGHGKNAKLQAADVKRKPTGETPAATPTADTTTETWKSERAHGVLRLLLAGHFKPVPEQRLRANFADLLPQPTDDPGPGIQPGDESPNDVGSTEVDPTDASPASAIASDADPTAANPADTDPAVANPTNADPTTANPSGTDPVGTEPRSASPDLIASPAYQQATRNVGALLFNAVNLFA